MEREQIAKLKSLVFQYMEQNVLTQEEFVQRGRGMFVRTTLIDLLQLRSNRPSLSLFLGLCWALEMSPNSLCRAIGVDYPIDK